MGQGMERVVRRFRRQVMAEFMVVAVAVVSYTVLVTPKEVMRMIFSSSSYMVEIETAGFFKGLRGLF